MKTWRKICLLLLALICVMPSAPAEATAARLAELGFLRADTQDIAAAVRNFQTANGLESTGTLDPTTLGAIADGAAVSRQDYLQALAGRYDAAALTNGSMGEDVRALQEGLIELGYYAGTADGVFGEGTRSAVMAFQTAVGLYASGEADRAVLCRLHDGRSPTWAEFISGKLCAKGDSGPGVRALQRRLRRLGYYDGECTASFGEVTQRAVERFQQENALEITGRADEATCALLYAGAPRTLADDGVLDEGDAGEDVRALQLLLNGLGYFGDSASGAFDAGTLVAVTLFQIANGFEPTGTADAALIEAMQRDGAVAHADASEALRASGAGAGAEVRARVAQAAEDMLGRPFVSGTDELFPGFAFAQYAFARAGVALTDPGQIVEGSGARVEDAAGLGAGELIALELSDESGARMFFAVCLGGGRAAYADAGTGFVVAGDLASMAYDSVYVWIFPDA